MFNKQLILKRIFYPAVVILGMSLFLMGLPSIPREFQTLWIVTANTPFLILIALMERYAPFRAEWNINPGDLRSDLIHSFVIFPVTVEAVYLGLQTLTQAPLQTYWISDAPLLVQLGVILLIAEAFYYGYHRLSHEYSGLWRLHAIHHGASRVYWLNSARFHIIDLTLSFACYLLPLALFGVPKEVYSLFVFINALTGLLEHGNIQFDAGKLNYLFNTAQLHRWHHSEKHLISQKNYGKVLSLWDWIFGTGYLPHEPMMTQPGIEGETVPDTYIQQFLYAFRGLKPVRKI